jgi:PHD/YefM family antitoxin component YafN of YafNO toxin-antitoxin module
MLDLKERYVVDDQGNRVAVFLDIADFNRLLEELEELESIRAFDLAKSSKEPPIPFEQAVANLERNRG